MKVEGLIPYAAMALTVIATLTMLVCCMAMGANASPAEIRTLKLWMTGFAVLGAVGVVGGFLLVRSGELQWAAGVAIAPAVVMAVIFLVAALR